MSMARRAGILAWLVCAGWVSVAEAGTASIGTLMSAQVALGDITIGANFAALDQNSTGFVPPDDAGWFGNGQFVQMTNGAFEVYSPTGTQLTTPITLNQFWRNGGAAFDQTAFDPRIMYDASSGHWFASAEVFPVGNAPNQLLIGVSQTADATGAWKTFTVPASPSGDHWADFGTLGFNSNGVFVAANMVNSTSPNPIDAVNLFVFPKADLIAGNVATRTVFNNVSGGSAGFSLQPVVNLDNGGLPHPILADSGQQDSKIVVSKIGGTNHRSDSFFRPNAAYQRLPGLAAAGGAASRRWRESATGFQRSAVLGQRGSQKRHDLGRAEREQRCHHCASLGAN
jgi:hypothetical protein